MKSRIPFISFLFVIFICISSKAQEITMFPGFFGYEYYQDDQSINAKEVNTLLMQNDRAYAYWNKSKTHMTIAWAALGAEVVFGIWAISRSADLGTFQAGPYLGMVGSAVVAIGFSFSSMSLKKKAILEYNRGLDGTSFLRLSPSENGLSLTYTF